MCGIAGILRLDDEPIDAARLRAMASALAHRGPDGDGVVVHGRCGLAHRRLAVVDVLSGAQPMSVEAAGAGDADGAGPLHLVFNGEVYHHRALRAKLEALGHRFRSDHSDSEVLLYGYRQWGRRLPKQLHGMYAFAVWDERARRLVLCRDRIGQKPLYLWWGADRRELVFASTVAGVVAGRRSGESIAVDRDALATYLRFGYPFADSLVAGVTELPAGHLLTVEADGREALEAYWRPPPVSKHSTALGAVDALREVLTESVDARLEADVPLGCFLSGGVDSSVVAALAQRRLRAVGEPPLRTFSVSMPDLRYDESAPAQAVAAHIGAEHTVLHADPSDAAADLERLMRVTGEPTADSSVLPTYWLCQAARAHVKVALSGDGGDELFGGYERYRGMAALARHGWWLRCVPAGWVQSGHAKAKRTKLRRLLRAAQAGPAGRDGWGDAYGSMVGLFDAGALRALGVGDAAAGRASESLVAGFEGGDAVHAAMRWDLGHYLPREVLRKVDRASMAVALEVRSPLLDTAVADLAGHLPARVLMPGGRSKGLLRALAAELVPTAIAQRRKMGFAVPLADWLRGPMRGLVGDRLVSPGFARFGLDDTPVPGWVDEHLDGRADHAHRLFALLQLSLWGDWLDAPRPA